MRNWNSTSTRRLGLALCVLTLVTATGYATIYKGSANDFFLPGADPGGNPIGPYSVNFKYYFNDATGIIIQVGAGYVDNYTSPPRPVVFKNIGLPLLGGYAYSTSDLTLICKPKSSTWVKAAGAAVYCPSNAP